MKVRSKNTGIESVYTHCLSLLDLCFLLSPIIGRSDQEIPTIKWIIAKTLLIPTLPFVTHFLLFSAPGETFIHPPPCRSGAWGICPGLQCGWACRAQGSSCFKSPSWESTLHSCFIDLVVLSCGSPFKSPGFIPRIQIFFLSGQDMEVFKVFPGDPVCLWSGCPCCSCLAG